MIKLFEEYSEYYTEVVIGPLYDKMITFDKKEVEDIKNYLYDLINYKEKCVSYIRYNKYGQLSNKDFGVSLWNGNTYRVEYTLDYGLILHINVRKLFDEWYLVNIGNNSDACVYHWLWQLKYTWFKCDQLEGLYKLLKDKLKI